MTLDTSILTVETDKGVDFAITASTTETTITSSRIDFESDGTWDETHTHGDHAITTTFHHAFTTEGVKRARAQVLAGNEVLATKTAVLVVSNRKTVVLAARAMPNSYAFPPCRADGPPLVTAGTTRTLSLVQDTRQVVGQFEPGSPVSFTQAFRQDAT